MLTMTTAGLATMLLAGVDTYDMTIDSEASTMSATSTLAAYLPGSLIGDWDEKANPGGTQTRPGLFGGDGNIPIDVDYTPTADGAMTGSPTGGFALDLDLDAHTVGVDGLSIDLLGGGGGSLDLTLVFEYETFRTFEPFSIFLGGFPLPIPLGQATVSTMSLTQTAPGAGTLVPDGDGGYTFALVAQAELSIVADVFGIPIDPGPLPLPLALAGSLTDECGAVTMSASFAEGLDETIPGSPDIGFTDLPFELPTISGDLAGVLLSAVLDSINFAADVEIVLVATGEGDGPTGDVTGDGAVNVDDLIAVLAAWGVCESCPADVDCDGAVDCDDVLVVLAQFEA